MSLGAKAAIVFVLMVAVGVLMVLARRRNYEGVRRHYTTRRTRVSVEPAGRSEPDVGSRPGEAGEAGRPAGPSRSDPDGERV